MRYIIIIVVIALALYLLYSWVKKGWDKVSFKVYFKSADLSGITLADLVAGVLTGGKNVNVVIGADITNGNTYQIVFSGLKVKLSYQGTVIAETSEGLASKKFIVPANGTLQIQDNATVILNKSGINILKEKIGGNGSTITYTVNVRVFGISIPMVSGNFKW